MSVSFMMRPCYLNKYSPAFHASHPPLFLLLQAFYEININGTLLALSIPRLNGVEKMFEQQPLEILLLNIY